MKRNYYSFGLLLIFAGILILLLNLRVLSFDMLLFLLSIGLMTIYFIQKHIGYIISGLILFAISSISLINEYIFPNINIKGFLFLWIFGIVSLVLYLRQNNKIFLIIGLILSAFGTYDLVKEIAFGNVSWVLYLLFSIAFYIAYIIDYRKSGIEWPKYLASILLVISFILLLLFGTMVEFKFWKFISYLISLLLIGIGIRIIYNIIRLRR